MDDDKMLTFAEVSRRLGVSNHMINKLVRIKAIESFSPGEGMPRRIWESELNRYRMKKRKSCEILEVLDISQTR